jgi:DNA-binding transcriptional regulator YdaS (Cro superfamily)
MIVTAADIKQQQAHELFELIKWVGGRARLAHTCGVTSQAVYEWVKLGQISKRAATIIHRKSDGFFKREELRPDVLIWNEEI